MSAPNDTPPTRRTSDADETPRLVRIWLPPTGRVASFVIGAIVVLRDTASEAQIVGGCGLMLAAIAGTAATWLGQRRSG